MAVVEHRRHAMRRKPGGHLSQAGVDLARRVGSRLAPFARVVTSTLPRAAETAVAMGFAVDDELEALSSLPQGFEEEVRWDAGFARLAKTVRQNPDGAAAEFARRLAALHSSLIGGLEPDGRLLIVSHGGIVEASAVGFFPGHDFASWDYACGYCEGVRLHFDSEACREAEVLQVR